MALKYYNQDYAYGGICDENTTWAMDAGDFEKITGSVLSSSSCYNKFESSQCGYGNDLIDNGGYYWFAEPYISSSPYTFYWSPDSRIVIGTLSYLLNGGRPVLRLASSVQVIGGSSTYEDPYQISYGE